MRKLMTIVMLTGGMVVVLSMSNALARGTTRNTGTSSVQHSLHEMDMGTLRRTSRNPNYHDLATLPPGPRHPKFKATRCHPHLSPLGYQAC